MALALLPTVKNTLSGVCLSFPVAGTASIIRAVKTVQSLTIATEWRINMSKKCVCGNEMTREDWKHEWVCHRCGRKRPVLYHLDKIERETKLNPRHIHDLIDLLEIALEVL